jgi:hypothetical protein
MGRDGSGQSSRPGAYASKPEQLRGRIGLRHRTLIIPSHMAEKTLSFPGVMPVCLTTRASIGAKRCSGSEHDP